MKLAISECINAEISTSRNTQASVSTWNSSMDMGVPCSKTPKKPRLMLGSKENQFNIMRGLSPLSSKYSQKVERSAACVSFHTKEIEEKLREKQMLVQEISDLKKMLNRTDYKTTKLIKKKERLENVENEVQLNASRKFNSRKKIEDEKANLNKEIEELGLQMEATKAKTKTTKTNLKEEDEKQSEIRAFIKRLKAEIVNTKKEEDKLKENILHCKKQINQTKQKIELVKIESDFFVSRVEETVLRHVQ